MNKSVSNRARFLLAAVSAAILFASSSALADSSDEWWDDAWPFRIPVTVSGAGIVSVSVDFTSVFSQLGLNEPLLDVRSIRVVPCAGVSAGDPIPHRETYGAMLEDAEDPNIGWASSGVYWNVNDGEAQGDSTRFSQGAGSLKAFVENLPEDEGGYGYPGVELLLAEGHPLSD